MASSQGEKKVEKRNPLKGGFKVRYISKAVGKKKPWLKDYVIPALPKRVYFLGKRASRSTKEILAKKREIRTNVLLKLFRRKEHEKRAAEKRAAQKGKPKEKKVKKSKPDNRVELPHWYRDHQEKSLYSLQEFVVIGRKAPTKRQRNPPLFRMRIFAKDAVVAKTQFWNTVSRLRKVKKAHGQILKVARVVEQNPLSSIKNYGVFLRYNSRTGTHNMYKEFRDVTRTGAVTQLYNDMAGRHKARSTSIQIISIVELKDAQCKRPGVLQFHGRPKFPLPHRVLKAAHKRHLVVFAKHRPSTFHQ